MGSKYRAQNTANMLGDCLVCLGFLLYFWGFLAVLIIIPKLRILTPGHIAILFGWFLELPKIRLNMDPRTPYLSPKYFLGNIRNIGTSLKILFSYMRIWKVRISHWYMKRYLDSPKHRTTSRCMERWIFISWNTPWESSILFPIVLAHPFKFGILILPIPISFYSSVCLQTLSVYFTKRTA